MPGLRFGCHYSVYPGDPLRYHSHFLTTGLGWDEEFDLLDIVGGGRLGTGVKKAYLIGGEVTGGKEAEDSSKVEEVTAQAVPSWNPALRPNRAEKEKKKPQVKVKPVRAFSIEWAGL